MGAGPSLVERLPRVNDDFIIASVRGGKGRMPGFGTKEISDTDMTNLIAYLRTLK
jgi:mono/diheme cytochrome c family protein